VSKVFRQRPWYQRDEGAARHAFVAALSIRIDVENGFPTRSWEHSGTAVMMPRTSVARQLA
jgi:hypothetical protein